MLMRRIYSFLLLLMTVALPANLFAQTTELTAVTEKTWNFSDWTAGDITATTITDNLEVNASESKKVAIDSNSKKIDDFEFTQRLKFNGTGAADTRNVHFKVLPNSEITVYGMSGSSNTERVMNVDIPAFGTNVASLTNDGNAIDKVTYIYKGESEADVYVYSTNSGFNIYAIVVKPYVESKTEIIDGIEYEVKSDNLFTNGSFDDGVTGWKTVGYTTDAVIDNFVVTAEGGFDGGAFITTNGGGVGSENTIRQSVAVEEGKMYLFRVYTNGKAPDANNFNYNALFKMTDAVTENGVIKAFEWPQGAGNTATEWSKTECIFTAESPYVGVRMGWNQNSSFDGFELIQVEQKTSELDAAKIAAKNQLDALATGDALFFYSEESVAAAKAAVEAATTTEEVEAALALPEVNTPVEGQAYAVANKTAEGNLNVASDKVSVETDAVVYFTAVEGGYAISNADGEYIFKTTDNGWTLSATTDIANAYIMNVNVVEGGYTLQGSKGLLGLDNTAAGSTVYANKAANNNGVWGITAVEEEAAPEDVTALIKNPAYLENGYEHWTYSENGFKTRAYEAPMNLITYSGNCAFEVSQTIENVPAGLYKLTVNAFYRAGSLEDEQAKVAAGTELEKELTMYANVDTEKTKYSNKVMNISEGAADAQIEGTGVEFSTGKYVPNSANDSRTWYIAGEYENEVLFNVFEDGSTVTIGLSKTVGLVGDYCPIGAWKLYRLGDADEAAAADYKEGGDTPEPGATFPVTVMTEEAVVDNWTRTFTGEGENGNFERNTWSTEADASEVRTPFIQSWIWGGNGAQLSPMKIEHTVITGLTPGDYTVKLTLRAYNEQAGSTTPSGLKVYANDGSVDLSEGQEFTFNNMAGVWDVFEVPATVGEDGTLTVGIDIYEPNMSWVAFKNLEVIYHDPNIPTVTPVEGKMNAEIAAAQDAAVAAFNADPTPETYEAALAAIAAAQKSADFYAPFVKAVEGLDEAGAAKFAEAEIAEAYNAGTVDETNPAPLTEALVAAEKAQTTPGSDLSLVVTTGTWVNQSGTYGAADVAERYSGTAYTGTAEAPTKVMYQHIEGLQPGEYTVKYLATANMAWIGAATGDGIAQLFANDVTEDIAVLDQTACNINDYPREAVVTVGEDGILEYGLQNVAEGGNWYVAKAISLTLNSLAGEDPLAEAKEAAIAKLDEYTPVGDDLFYYSQEAIDAVKAAIEAATTEEELAAAAVEPAKNLPEEGKAYFIANKTAAGNLNIGGNTVNVTAGAKVYFTAVEGGYVLSNEEGEYIFKSTGDTWTLNTTANIEEAYKLNFNVVDGGYTIQGANGLFGTDQTVDGSTVYANKNAGNNGVWGISEATDKNALANAIAAAQTQADSYLIGDGLFQYAEDEIAPLKEAIAAAQTVYDNPAATEEEIKAAQTTLEEFVAGFAPQATSPDPETAYQLALTTSEGTFYLNVVDGAIRIGDTPQDIYIKDQGNGTYAIANADDQYVVYAGGDRWTMTASAEPYGWTIKALADGGYNIQGTNGLLGTNTSDGNGAGSPCYGDKSAANGNVVWAIDFSTGIRTINSDAVADLEDALSAGRVFDLSGRQIRTITANGIYIVNGRKMAIRK